MQIWYPGPDVRDSGDYEVTLNPGNKHPFAIITLSEDRNTALIVQSPEEADRLIKAAVEAKRLLAPSVITDSERDCDQKHPETGAWCHRSGEHTEHRDTYGETWTAAEPELTVRERAQRGARKAAEREAAGEGDLEDAAAQDEDEAETTGPPRPVCECGHSGAVHSFNVADGELTHCNECNTCQTYESTLASVTA